ncbi:MAG: nucleotidyltransferase domain-containing protein [Acidobacteriaceae bacterium]
MSTPSGTSSSTQQADLRSEWIVTPAKVTTLVRSIVREADPAKIVAFGSRARGTARRDSDLDLAVILDAIDTTAPNPVMRHRFEHVSMPYDLIVTSRAHHELLRNSRNSVHYHIAHEGVVLYDRDTGFADSSAVEKVG